MIRRFLTGSLALLTLAMRAQAGSIVSDGGGESPAITTVGFTALGLLWLLSGLRRPLKMLAPRG